MTSIVVTPIRELPVDPDRDAMADDFVDLLAALADLGVRARRQRDRLTALPSAADERVRGAVEHLAELERHAYAVGVEAARVRHELQQARLI